MESVTLKSGDVIDCGKVLNASGPRAIETAKMAGVTVPVEPRNRILGPYWRKTLSNMCDELASPDIVDDIGTLSGGPTL